MRKAIRSIFDIREGEVKVTLLMLFNIFLLLLTFYFLKPARDSLFLVKLGADQLPYVFILTAIVIIPVTTLYSKASRLIKLNRLIIYTLAILIICLFGLRYLMSHPTDWVPYIFYAWVSVYGALATSQFWLLANQIYTATQAKRLFPLLGLGGIFGAFSGGEITNLIIEYFDVSTENLLLFCVGFLLISIIVIKLVWNSKKSEIESIFRKSKKETLQKESFLSIFGSIVKSKHLLLIVGILSIMMIVGTLIDFQFKAVTTDAFTDSTSNQVDKSGLTAFLGTFYGRLSLVSMMIQLFFAGKIIKKMGVGSVILFLPIGLMFGSIAFFGFTSLIAAVLLRGTGEALENSIDKTGRELLFLPVSPELKKRTKLFIDLFVDRVARGVAGFLLLLLIAVFGFEQDFLSAIKSMSIVVMVLLLLWIVLAVMMRKEYVNTFRMAIENRELNLSDIRQQINESSTINILISSLQSHNDREIIYALDMLEDVENESLFEPLKELTTHKSEEIVLKALKLLKPYYKEIDDSMIEKFLTSQNCQIRIQAFHLSILKTPNDSHRIISSYLKDETSEHRLTAICFLAEFGDEMQKELIAESMISNIMNHYEQDSDNLEHLVIALGKLQISEYSKFIRQLLSHPNENVVNQAIISIRYIGDLEFTDWLIQALLDQRYRVEARKSLASFGTAILFRLKDELISTDSNWQFKREIPKVIRMVHDQYSIDIFLESLPQVPMNFSIYIVKSLSKLRANCPDLDFYPQKIDEIIISETKKYYTYLQISELLKNAEKDADYLLNRALEERLQQTLEEIFRLLGLNHPPKDIYNAYQSIVSNNSSIRASASEFLDNILEWEIKKYLLPIFDEQNRRKIARDGLQLFKTTIRDKEEALVQLINGNEIWLKSLAIYVARDLKTEKITQLIKNMKNTRIMVVREAIDLYFEDVAL